MNLYGMPVTDLNYAPIIKSIKRPTSGVVTSAVFVVAGLVLADSVHTARIEKCKTAHPSANKLQPSIIDQVQTWKKFIKSLVAIWAWTGAPQFLTTASMTVRANI